VNHEQKHQTYRRWTCFGIPMATAKSQRRPEVICKNLDRLVRELQYLDARNLTRDKIFEGVELKATAFVTAPTEDARAMLRQRYPEAEVEERLFLSLKSVEIDL